MANVDRSVVNRAFLILLLAVFFDLFGVALVVPLLPQYARNLKMDGRQMGYLGSLYGITQLLGAPVLGRVSDTKGRKSVLVISCVGAAVAYLVAGYATSVLALYTSRLIIGLFKQTTSAAQAYVSDLSNADERNVMLGRISMAVGVAFIIGPAIGGRLTSYSLETPVLVAACCFFVELMLILFMLEEPSVLRRAGSGSIELEPLHGHKRKDSAAAESPVSASAIHREWTTFKRFLQDGSTRRLFVIIFVSTIALQTYQSSMLLSLQERFELTPEYNGYVWAYLGLLSAVVQGGAIRPLSSSYSDRDLQLMALVTMAIAHAMLAMAPSLQYWMLVHPLVSLGENVLRTTLVGSATKAVSKSDVGGMLGIVGSMNSVCRIIGPLIGGELMKRYGTRAPSWFLTLVVSFVATYAVYSRSYVSDRARTMIDQPVTPGVVASKDTPPPKAAHQD